MENRFVKVSPNFKLVSHSLFEPKHFDNDEGTPSKYSIMMVFDKATTDMSIINTAIKDCWEASCLKAYKNVLPLPKSPLRDGDSVLEQALDEQKRNIGKYILFASRRSDFGKPEVFKPNGHKLDINTEKDLIYPGILARASLMFRSYSKGKGAAARLEGVTCTLVGIQKVDDGERLSGLPSCSFDAVQEQLSAFPNVNTEGLDDL
jgi:hypothetical protein